MRITGALFCNLETPTGVPKLAVKLVGAVIGLMRLHDHVIDAIDPAGAVVEDLLLAALHITLEQIDPIEAAHFHQLLDIETSNRFMILIDGVNLVIGPTATPATIEARDA